MNRIWIELYPKIIRENGKKIKKASGKDLYAVVKNNGYGLGCQRVAQALRGIAKGFCVGNVEEGISLREIGISEEIIILGYSAYRCRVRRSRIAVGDFGTRCPYGRSNCFCS